MQRYRPVPVPRLSATTASVAVEPNNSDDVKERFGGCTTSRITFHRHQNVSPLCVPDVVSSPRVTFGFSCLQIAKFGARLKNGLRSPLCPIHTGNFPSLDFVLCIRNFFRVSFLTR